MACDIPMETHCKDHTDNDGGKCRLQMRTSGTTAVSENVIFMANEYFIKYSLCIFDQTSLNETSFPGFCRYHFVEGGYVSWKQALLRARKSLFL